MAYPAFEDTPEPSNDQWPVLTPLQHEAISIMLKKAIRAALRQFGYGIAKYIPSDFETRHREIIERAGRYTLTSPERIHALIESTRYILENNVKGSFVECGVYRGGSMMAIALTLLAEGVQDRELYLFDTFAGMPEPGKRDVDFRGSPAIEKFSRRRLSAVSSTWTNASIEIVKEAMLRTDYPMDRVHFVKGMVEDTIPREPNGAIALLRLDTDWYASTRHELVHLYPLVSGGGIVIVDDYGHFKGAREAVDEYFADNKMRPFLHRIDYTGRLLVKER